MNLHFLGGLLFSIGFMAMGATFILGTWKKWPIFVNPPDDWWPYYSQSLIKKILGRKGLIVFNYGFGALSIIAALFGLFNLVRSFVSE